MFSVHMTFQTRATAYASSKRVDSTRSRSCLGEKKGENKQGISEVRQQAKRMEQEYGWTIEGEARRALVFLDFASHLSHVVGGRLGGA